MTAPGWYQADGDPAGTTRYWDGERWVGNPVELATSSGSGGFSVSGQQSSGYQLASSGSRMGARAIDLLILAVISIVVLWPFISDVIDVIDTLGPNPSQAQIQTVVELVAGDYSGRLLSVGIMVILWDFLWVAFVGATPGKLLLGLRVARADNGATPPGFGKAALRSLHRLLGVLPGIAGLGLALIGLVSLILLFVDDQHRTVMDRIASTVVIKK